VAIDSRLATQIDTIFLWVSLVQLLRRTSETQVIMISIITILLIPFSIYATFKKL